MHAIHRYLCRPTTSLLLAAFLVGPPSHAANESAPVQILASSNPSFPLLDQARVQQIVRSQLLASSPLPYALARVRVRFSETGMARYLIVYLMRSDAMISETARITLAPGYVVTAVDLEYQQQESDLEPGSFSAHGVDMVFDTPVSFIDTAKAGVDAGCQSAAAAGYACDILLDAQATVQELRNYMASPRVKAVGNIGHGNPGGIALADGDLTAGWFADKRELLNGKVLYFNSCSVHNAPLDAAIMAAGARTYIGGNVALPIGPSEEVFKCFWSSTLQQKAAMGSVLGACEDAQGLTGFHGISGDAGRFADSLVGDIDNFTPGDIADTPPTSPRVKRVLAYFAGQIGQGAGVGLDTGGADRPVGLTHLLALPPGARVTSANITARIMGTDPLVFNDIILFNESVSATEQTREPCPADAQCDGLAPFLPYIALRDLLHEEPQLGFTYDVGIDLARVPLRLSESTGGPGGSQSPSPDEHRNLLGLVNSGRFDLIFGDDVKLDYSNLRLTYVLPTAPPGDLDGDDTIDRGDLDIVTAALGTEATVPVDPRDLDGDGKITVLDARKLVLLCTRAKCAR